MGTGLIWFCIVCRTEYDRVIDEAPDKVDPNGKWVCRRCYEISQEDL